MAQRLMRRICERCAQPQELTQAEIESLRLDGKTGPFFKGAGCQNCYNTGYKGRIAAHEWLKMTRSIKDMVVKGASVDELRDQAVKEGMITLRNDALAKALAGKTTVTEILRVTKDEVLT